MGRTPAIPVKRKPSRRLVVVKVLLRPETKRSLQREAALQGASLSRLVALKLGETPTLPAA